MRRKDREITEFTKIIDIIDKCDVCRLGLIDDGEAYIVPMNFGYEVLDDGISLYFHGAGEGRKMSLIPQQSVVSFEMDRKHELVTADVGCQFSYLYQCVMGTGTIESLCTIEEKTHGLERIMEHYTGKKQWEFDEKLLERTAILKLSVQSVSCKEH